MRNLAIIFSLLLLPTLSLAAEQQKTIHNTEASVHKATSKQHTNNKKRKSVQKNATKVAHNAHKHGKHVVHRHTQLKKPVVRQVTQEIQEIRKDNNLVEADNQTKINDVITVSNINSENEIQMSDASNERMQSFLNYVTSFVGAPYRYSGTSPETGFDCSGYVQYVYKHQFGVELPHNAAAISHYGDIIAKTNLRPGDLVLFKTLRRTLSHIGIYLGGHRFIHASSTRTGIVEISDLRENYWSRKFAGARRLQWGPLNDSLS